jgi:antitoxin FitA
MSKMIQIGGVCEEVYRTRKARAADEGMSLSDYLKRQLTQSAALPKMQEWLERTERIRPIRRSKTPA